MTRRVVGERIQEDTVKTYSRDEAQRQLDQCKSNLSRWQKQLTNTTEAISQCNADITEWEAMLAELPPLPEEPEVKAPVGAKAKA